MKGGFGITSKCLLVLDIFKKKERRYLTLEELIKMYKKNIMLFSLKRNWL